MALDYPDSLPSPQTLLATPFARAQYSDEERPRDSRALSTDRLAVVRATWPPLSPEEAEVFYDFWKDDLIDGGAWFNATWPLPQGSVPSVFRFIEQPRWRFVPGGRWRIEAVMEQRGRTLAVSPAAPSVSERLAWFDPVTGLEGTLLRSNTGSGNCSDFSVSPVTQLYAGVIGWVDETVIWSIASWVSGSGHPSPTIGDAADQWVMIQWENTYGGGAPIADASIGTLILTATINGESTAVGDRLLAVTTPPTEDYPTIAWSPE